jgi:hypothetical protein
VREKYATIGKMPIHSHHNRLRNAMVKKDMEMESLGMVPVASLG